MREERERKEREESEMREERERGEGEREERERRERERESHRSESKPILRSVLEGVITVIRNRACARSRADIGARYFGIAALIAVILHQFLAVAYGAHVSPRQHTSAYVSTRQHTSAHVSIRQHTSTYVAGCRCVRVPRCRSAFRVSICTFVPVKQVKAVPIAVHAELTLAAANALALFVLPAGDVAVHICVSIHQHTSAYVTAYVSVRHSIRQHTSAYVSIRQHTSAHVSTRQHTSAYVTAYVSTRQHTSAHVSIYARGKVAVLDGVVTVIFVLLYQ
jgi:hypothetical protein